MQSDCTPTPSQQRLLRALYDEGGLSTALLAQYVAADLSKSRLHRALTQLQAGGLIRSQLVQQERCWVLHYNGTRALGCTPVHGEARYRFPTISQLAAKALSLQLTMTLRGLGWTWVRPVHYNPSHPKPDATPQYQAVYRAVAYHFQQHMEGAPDAAARAAPILHPSHVPAGQHDWVAWPVARPQQTVVLIIHPIGGTRHFWTTYDQARRKRSPARTAAARMQSYQPLAQILPVIGVFATWEQARDFTPLLATAHFHACTIADLAPFLYHYAAC
jgi:hypothetical protein